MKNTRRIRRRRQTRRKRRGGKKLGEGKAGFVVDPAVPCAGSAAAGSGPVAMEGVVTKVFTDKETFEKAKKNLEPVLTKLKEIDPDQTSFLYPEFCGEMGELTKENKEDGVTEENKHWSYSVKKGGVTLEKELKEQANHITTAEDAAEYLKPIIQSVTTLLEKLHNNGIIHRDVHPGNVLRMDDGTFRMIDFDRALVFDPDEIEKQGWRAHEKIEDEKAIDKDDFMESSAFLFVENVKDFSKRSTKHQKIVDLIREA